MSVSLNPSSSLGFNRPLTQLVKRSLTIHNPNTQPVAFKVKTTAPKLYCVRPNSGRIEPGETAEIAVMLQAMKEEPPLSTKCRDKFLIQSTVITWDKQTMAVQDIWSTTDSGEDSKVFQQKLKVVYLPPDGQIVEEEEEGPANMSSMLEANESRYDTVRQNSSANGHPTEPLPDFDMTQLPPPLSVSEVDPAKIVPREPQPPLEDDERSHTPPADFNAEQDDSTHEPDSGGLSDHLVHTPPSPPHVVAPLPEPSQLDYDVLQAKFEMAQAEINRLRALLADAPRPPSSELRRRHLPVSDDGSTMGETDVGTVVEDNPLQQEGVPLQVVIVIALGVFITTYLFF